MTDLPLWFWLVIAVMNLFSLLWMLLILRDVRQEVSSQLWIVGEQNRESLRPVRLGFYRLAYVLLVVLMSVLSVLLIPVIL